MNQNHIIGTVIHSKATPRLMKIDWRESHDHATVFGDRANFYGLWILPDHRETQRMKCWRSNISDLWHLVKFPKLFFSPMAQITRSLIYSKAALMMKRLTREPRKPRKRDSRLQLIYSSHFSYAYNPALKLLGSLTQKIEKAALLKACFLLWKIWYDYQTTQWGICLYLENLVGLENLEIFFLSNSNN